MDAHHARTLRSQGFGILVGLGVQYFLGMYVNLFAPFPEGISGGAAWAYTWSNPAIAAHMLVGALLVAGAIVFVVRAFKYKSDAWEAPSIWGLIAILAAAWGGSEFVPTQSDAYSYIMAAFFFIAASSYSWGLSASYPYERAEKFPPFPPTAADKRE